MIQLRQIFLCVILSLVSGALLAQDKLKELNEVDGPYIFYAEKGVDVLRVGDNGISRNNFSNKDTTFWVSSSDKKYQFDISLHSVARPQWDYKLPGGMLIVSDPHGDMEAFVSILRSQKVIDKDYKWIFGKKHLIVIGDVFDRGKDVLPIFWLIYKLENEAMKAGGMVHFILGNHEEMVLRNNVKYTQDKYKNLAQYMGVRYCDLWKENSVLGHWLLTRNTIERIGDNLFVHAGLSEEFASDNWSIPQLNDTVSAYIRMTKEERKVSANADFLFGSNGPLWYRGMVKTDDKYNPISDSEVRRILDMYNVRRIYVGHTIFKDVSSFFNGSVIGVNVDNRKNMEAGRSRGVLVKKGKQYIVYDDARKQVLFK